MDKKCVWESGLAAEFWNNGRLPFTVYDVHGHMGYHPQICMSHGTPEKMVRHLRRSGSKLIFSHHYSLFDNTFSNQQVYDIVKQYPDDLRFYLSIIPHDPERIEKDIEMYDQWKPYVCGVKILAAYHKVKITDAKFDKILTFANEKKLPVLFHTWGNSANDGAEPVLELTKRYPDITYLIGHSFYWSPEAVERVVKESKAKAYFELTSIPGQEGRIEVLTEIAGGKRILYGTDLPWFDEYQAIGGVLSARISNEDKKAILHDNAVDIFGSDLP